jgi:hypothetical protein
MQWTPSSYGKSNAKIAFETIKIHVCRHKNLLFFARIPVSSYPQFVWGENSVFASYPPKSLFFGGVKFTSPCTSICIRDTFQVSHVINLNNVPSKFVENALSCLAGVVMFSRCQYQKSEIGMQVGQPLKWVVKFFLGHTVEFSF